METAWISHPNLPGQPTEVPKSAVPVHMHSGWVLAEPPDVERPEDKALAELETEKPADTSDVPQSVSKMENADESGTGSTETSEEPTGAKRARRANAPKGAEQ